MFCKRVTIFEGPDGSGKSTAATAFAESTGARLVHCGPFLRQTGKGLGRTYLEAMMPALQGYQDVVLDRAWPSEFIYGRVFRDADRLGIAGRRILERIALRCDARVVLCLPELETCLTSWRKRHAEGGEYLEKEGQLTDVWRRYSNAHTYGRLASLPLIGYDYTRGPLSMETVTRGIHGTHVVGEPSSGSYFAKVLLVGEGVTMNTDYDGLALYPFSSLDPAGCSRWLAEKLEREGIDEDLLLWTNATDPGAWEVVENAVDREMTIVALSGAAARWLDAGDIGAEVVENPQAWRRFHSVKRYPLLDLLKELLA